MRNECNRPGFVASKKIAETMENLFLNHKGNKKIKISNNGLTRHGLEQTNTDTIGNMMRFKQYYVYRSIDRAKIKNHPGRLSNTREHDTVSIM